VSKRLSGWRRLGIVLSVIRFFGMFFGLAIYERTDQLKGVQASLRILGRLSYDIPRSIDSL